MNPDSLVSGYLKSGSRIVEKTEQDKLEAATARPAVKAALTTAGAGSITAAMLADGIVLRSGATGGNVADTLPLAADYIAEEEARGGFPIGASKEYVHVNNVGTHTMTITTNTGWTLTGTMTVATGTARRFKIIRTGAATCELISLGVSSGA